MNHILEIVGMTFGVLGSAHIWKYFTERLKAKNEEKKFDRNNDQTHPTCLLYTSPSPRDRTRSRMPSSA